MLNSLLGERERERAEGSLLGGGDLYVLSILIQ